MTIVDPHDDAHGGSRRGCRRHEEHVHLVSDRADLFQIDALFIGGLRHLGRSRPARSASGGGRRRGHRLNDGALRSRRERRSATRSAAFARTRSSAPGRPSAERTPRRTRRHVHRHALLGERSHVARAFHGDRDDDRGRFPPRRAIAAITPSAIPSAAALFSARASTPSRTTSPSAPIASTTPRASPLVRRSSSTRARPSASSSPSAYCISSSIVSCERLMTPAPAPLEAGRRSALRSNRRAPSAASAERGRGGS